MVVTQNQSRYAMSGRLLLRNMKTVLAVEAIGRPVLYFLEEVTEFGGANVISFEHIEQVLEFEVGFVDEAPAHT